MTQRSPETKAAVLAALLTGQSISQVAEQYSLPEGTVGRWRADAVRRGDLKIREEVKAEERDEIGRLLKEYVRESLITLTEQAKHFRSKPWLEQQSAADLAVLHGVCTDKLVRILAASEPGDGGLEPAAGSADGGDQGGQ